MKDDKERTKETEREKEKETEKSTNTPENDEWLWMEYEAPYPKEGDEEFWDIKDGTSYEPPSVSVEEGSDFVDLGSFVSEEYELSSDTS